MNKKQKKNLIRIITSAAIFTAVLILNPAVHLEVELTLFHGKITTAGKITEDILLTTAYLIVGYDILRKALKGIKNRQPFDECFLMTVATLGAVALGDFREAVSVMLFYQTGELFQSIAVGKSRRSISQLMDLRPDVAYVIVEDGELQQTEPDEVPVGSIIAVRPGEKVPIDGTIVSGSSLLDTVALTGESVPRSCAEGDCVLSGCINPSALLHIRTEKEFGGPTVSKILDLVENASSRKSRSEGFITRFAQVYTPAVCFAALAVALLVPCVRLLAGLPGAWGIWIYRALTFLVISCPCALVISIPLAFFAGIGGAGNQGILIKGSNYLESLSRLDCVVFDKTGTLTRGSFKVTGIHHSPLEDKELLRYAAAAESSSLHPISRSLIEAWNDRAPLPPLDNLEELPGRGVKATVEGHSVAVGNDGLMNSLGVPCKSCGASGTLVHVAIDGEYAGHIVISDELKPGSVSAISSLKELGVTETVMLTGDRKEVGEAVAGELGIDSVYSELLPGDKVEKLEQLLKTKKPGTMIAFVGDGINDAPVLTRADIGIAMGALGSDAAIEAADVVLMDDKPEKIAKAVRMARKCMRIVYENLWFAIGVKLLCLVLGALGIANMWYAIFADVGVMVLAVLNALRALR